MKRDIVFHVVAVRFTEERHFVVQLPAVYIFCKERSQTLKWQSGLLISPATYIDVPYKRYCRSGEFVPFSSPAALVPSLLSSTEEEISSWSPKYDDIHVDKSGEKWLLTCHTFLFGPGMAAAVFHKLGNSCVQEQVSAILAKAFCINYIEVQCTKKIMPVMAAGD